MTNLISWKPMVTAAMLSLGAQVALASLAHATDQFSPTHQGASFSLASAGYEIGMGAERSREINFMVNRFAQPKPEKPRKRPSTHKPIKLSGNSSVAQLRSLIAIAEAGAAGYDAVQLGARIKPPKKPTQMTLAEILLWIKKTPGQQHAIGRYQIIPSTLKSLIRHSGIGTDTLFSREVQDAMADILLLDAGYDRFSCGRLTRHAFMENLARIWAGLPTASGASAYEGFASNRATITWASYSDAISTAFPAHAIKANVNSPSCQRRKN